MTEETITDEKCDFCGADLRASQIPQEYVVAGHYGDLDSSVPHYYSRRCGVEYAYGHPQRYDGVSEWQCPDCGARVGRWSGRLLQEGEAEPRPR